MSMNIEDGAARLTLLTLTRWELWVGSFFQGRPFFEDFARDQLLVHLRNYYPSADVAPSFPDALLTALLQRLIDGRLPDFDAELQGPLTWLAEDKPTAHAAQESERREVLRQVIEGAASGVVDDYCQSLRRKWAARPAGLDEASEMGERFLTRLDEHCKALKELFCAETLKRFSGEALREYISGMDERWSRLFEDGGGLPDTDRQQIDSLVRVALGEWFIGLNGDDLEVLRNFQRRHALLREQVRLLFQDVSSLQEHARLSIISHVRARYGLELEPDALRVETRLSHPDFSLSRVTRLAELVSEGPFAPKPEKARSLRRDAGALNQELPAGFLDDLLREVDPRATYHLRLSERYAGADVLKALYDLYDVRLQQSAYIARCKGHLSGENHARVMRARAGLSDDQVSAVSQFPDEPLAELLLFYGEDENRQPSGLILYAPGKPDGQEWIELPSLRALAVELGGWLGTEAGSRYLLDRINARGQARAEQFYSNVRERPDTWDLNRDHRGAGQGYEECCRYLVTLGQYHHLAQVEWYEAPHWVLGLPVDKRQHIAALNEDLRLLNEAMQHEAGEQESFLAFASRTVKADTLSYLEECGVIGEVDPQTLLFDIFPDLGASAKVTRTLLDLAMYGYDDNWGLDNPRMPVRSSVGQDLSGVRASDLETYLRSAYIGERYAKSIRSEFLDARNPLYARRRALHLRMLRTTLLRDLQVAHGKGMVESNDYDWLLEEVENLDRVQSHGGDSADNIAGNGAFRFTLNGRNSVGVYVFRRIIDGEAHDWLYTPQAPDGITLRKYRGFVGARPGAMHDWFLQQMRFVDRAAVSEWLTQLAEGDRSRDTLREGNRIVDFMGEYDAYLNSHISDIEAVTRSRHEVIVEQVTKGLLYAAFPLSLAFPPLGFVLDAVFFAIGSARAIASHLEKNESAALNHWVGVAAALWGLALPGAWGALTHVGRAGLRRTSEVSRWNQLTEQARPGVRQGERAAVSILDEKRALKSIPNDLRVMERGGIWRGVYRHSPGDGQETFYINDRGRYFQVMHDRDMHTLRLIDSQHPGAQYRVPLRLGARNRWQFNEQIGLRGGAPTVHLGHVGEVIDAFPARLNPLPERGVLQGEGLIARFNPGGADNYLYSLNVQSCVVACLYSAATRSGVVIHIDHNLSRLIDEALDAALGAVRQGGGGGRISATLVGGDWLSMGADIGGPVRSALARRGIQADWDHWSYSSCMGNIYGVHLDLAEGTTSVFTTTRSSVQKLIDPILLDATRGGSSPLAQRARRFMARFRGDALVQNRSGEITTLAGRPATSQQIEAQTLQLTTLAT